MCWWIRSWVFSHHQVLMSTVMGRTASDVPRRTLKNPSQMRRVFGDQPLTYQFLSWMPVYVFCKRTLPLEETTLPQQAGQYTSQHIHLDHPTRR